MVRLFIYINNKSKTDGRFIFSGMVRLIEPCSPLPMFLNRYNYFLNYWCAFRHFYVLLQLLGIMRSNNEDISGSLVRV